MHLGVLAVAALVRLPQHSTYSLPFIFIDRDIPIGIFVRYAPAPPEGPAASKAAQIAQSTGHVAQSHLGGLVSRPVSSLYRLLFVARDVAVETVTPSWMVTSYNFV